MNNTVIDDCRSEKQRVNGRLVPDHKKFPDGVKSVHDFYFSIKFAPLI